MLVGVPANVTVECHAVPAVPNVTATDNCGSAVVTYLGAATNGTAPCNYTIVRSWKAADACGNAVTNKQTITVRDTTRPAITCPPNMTVSNFMLFCGYTQGGWGTKPSGNNPGSILAQNFTRVYPGGFVEIGIPGASGYSVKLTSASAVQAYLPDGSTPQALQSDVINPVTTAAGVFGAQILSCRLNVDFSDAGLTGGSTGTLGDLVYSETGSPLNGKTVREILAIANTALGGGNISAYNISISALSSLINQFNIGFDGCTATAWAKDHLLPTNSPPSTGSPSVSDNCDPQLTVTYRDAVACANSVGGYTITRTWTATDDCGNSSSCSQAISFVGRPPVGLTATCGSASVALKWKDCPGSTSYNVKRSTVSGGPYTVLKTGLTTTNHTDNTAVNGTIYYYVVSAIRSGTETCNSPQVIAIPCAPLPSPWRTNDIGAVAASGAASYANSKFTVIGSGADIGGTADEFRYLYQPASGDCTIVARVASIANTDPRAKAGVMIRETLTDGSKHASAFVTPGNGVSAQARTVTGGNSVNVNVAGLTAPYWLKVVRSGNTFTSSYSANGTTWTLLQSQSITMGSSVYIGIAVTSRNDGVLCTAIFDNLTATP
jgi:hypothetical protein